MKKHYLLIFTTILIINFFLPRFMPGDPFLYLSVDDGNVSVAYSEKQIEEYKAYYGLDRPLYIQFLNYIKGLLKGDLGYSIYYNISVLELIFTRLPWTLFIVLTSLLISSIIGVFLGTVSAYSRNGFLDKFAYFSMTVFSEIPSFLLGIFLLFIFAARLGLFPLAGGMTAFGNFQTKLYYLIDIIYHGTLPVLTLSLVKIGEFYLLARSSMLTVLSQDYIQTAKGKGLKKKRILFYHALRNGMPPIVARIFMSLGGLFGGAILVENVFSYPGVGRLMREAFLVRDYVLIQGILLIIAIMVLFFSYLSDVFCKKMDPRIG
ncbi:MAG: ABC transporter permease [Peptostreptococcales bacterium]|jgi:peptide/nickel transport system permease protein